MDGNVNHELILELEMSQLRPGTQYEVLPGKRIINKYAASTCTSMCPGAARIMVDIVYLISL